MDFFEQQERARRSSRRLVLGYALAVLSVIASYCLAAGVTYAFRALLSGGLPLRGDAPLDCPVPPLLAAQDPKALAA